MSSSSVTSLPRPALKALFLSLPGSLKLVTPEGAPVRGLRTPEIPMTEAVEAVGTWRLGSPGSSVEAQ